ncbi:MAG: hypothetical protein FWC97_00290 [Treponema sp.]|nr:hypothetical protein [Treponema sp.]
MKLLRAWTWEILQTLAAMIALLLIGKGIEQRAWYKGHRIIIFNRNYNWFTKIFASCALGYFIFLPTGTSIITLVHEYGHCKQSARLGPLYLFFIGIPSITRHLIARHWRKTEKKNNDEIVVWYYSAFPEKQADILGGVIWENGKRVLEID